MTKKKLHHRVLDEISTHGAIEAVKLLAHAGAHVSLTATDLAATGGLYLPAKWATKVAFDKIRGVSTYKVVDPDTGTILKIKGRFEKTPEGLLILKRAVERPKVVKTGEQYAK